MYLGYELDSLRMESWLPLDKFAKCVDKRHWVLQHKKLTIKQLQFIIDLLNFACNVTFPGGAFL